MLYCYDCGSNNIKDITDGYYENNHICNKCGSRKIFDDEEEDLEEKILERLVKYIFE